MTFTTFLDLVNEYIDVQGEAYVEDADEQQAPVIRAIDRFTEDTDYFFSDEGSFTPVVSSRTVDIDSMTPRFYSIENVWVNGNKLRKIATHADMALIAPGYADDSDGEPGYWWMDGPSDIMFEKGFASAYSNSRVSGNHFHTTIVDGNSTMEFADRDIEAVAIECAIALMHPRASGSMLERIEFLEKTLAIRKAKIKARTTRYNDPTPIRRRRMTSRTLL